MESNETFVYNTHPGNPSTAGQVATAGSHVPQRGRAADSIVMPDSAEDVRAAAGVRVGSITVVRGAGFYQSIEVLTDDGRTLRSEGALFAIYDALMAQQAEREAGR